MIQISNIHILVLLKLRKHKQLYTIQRIIALHKIKTSVMHQIDRRRLYLSLSSIIRHPVVGILHSRTTYLPSMKLLLTELEAKMIIYCNQGREKEVMYLTTSQNSKVLQYGLPAVTKSGCLDSTNLFYHHIPNPCNQIITNNTKSLWRRSSLFLEGKSQSMKDVENTFFNQCAWLNQCV